MDEGENEEDEEKEHVDETDGDYNNDDDKEEEEEEYDDDSDDDKKIRAWDALMNITTKKMQDRFNETENPGTDIQEAEEKAYDELKQMYLSDFIPRYKYVVELSTALKKDPVNKRIASTAKRLREEDYDEDESRQYAIKKRKFLNTIFYKPMSSFVQGNTCKRGTALIPCFIVHS